ncbi:MAG: hypothetical protein WCP20_09595 [Desulfuromonadales bacterium]
MSSLNSNPLERSNDLLTALKDKMPILEDLLARVQDKWVSEDGIYRFYHGSYKVYQLQDATVEIVTVLQSIMPERKLTEYFMTIIQEGTGKRFNKNSNRRWVKETRPITEAFFHARYFLEMAVKYGKKLDLVENTHPESFEEKLRVGIIPSGMAAVLCLYEM